MERLPFTAACWSAETVARRTTSPEEMTQRMASRVKDLAEFLRADPLIWCGSAEGAGSTEDPYTAAAKRILLRVHQSESPVADQDRQPIRTK